MSVPAELKNIVEAALLAAGGPLSLDSMLNLFTEEEAPQKKQLREVLAELEQDYAGRGIEIREVASGWRIQVTEAVSPWVSRLWTERPARYSRALMETLALVAYRQPITRGEIEDIRGVSVSSNIVKTLIERDWIRVVGQRDVPGKPSLYGTTREFLDYFNLKTLDELPTLAEIRDLDEINRELDLNDTDKAEPLETADADSASDAEAVSDEARLAETIDDDGREDVAEQAADDAGAVNESLPDQEADEESDDQSASGDVQVLAQAAAELQDDVLQAPATDEASVELGEAEADASEAVEALLPEQGEQSADVIEAQGQESSPADEAELEVADEMSVPENSAPESHDEPEPEPEPEPAPASGSPASPTAGAIDPVPASNPKSDTQAHAEADSETDIQQAAELAPVQQQTADASVSADHSRSDPQAALVPDGSPPDGADTASPEGPELKKVNPAVEQENG